MLHSVSAMCSGTQAACRCPACLTEPTPGRLPGMQCSGCTTRQYIPSSRTGATAQELTLATHPPNHSSTHTSKRTEGHDGSTATTFGATAADVATADSSACPQMYCTTSGPSVSYSGTETMPYAWRAASTSIHSAPGPAKPRSHWHLSAELTKTRQSYEPCSTSLSWPHSWLRAYHASLKRWPPQSLIRTEKIAFGDKLKVSPLKLISSRVCAKAGCKPWGVSFLLCLCSLLDVVQLCLLKPSSSD
jgi:hypothetical protein